MVLVRQFPVPDHGVKLQTQSIEAFVDNEDHGKGTLFVTEANIAWINGNTGEGFKIAYKKMTLHAISRDPGVHANACLYIMVNGNVLDEDENFEVECPVEVDESDEEMTEIRFVPDDAAVLEEMYKTIQECSLLNPDPSSDLSNDDPDEMFEGFHGGESIEDEEDEELDEEEQEAERLEQFMRLQLQFREPRNDENDGSGNGNGNGNSGGGGSRNNVQLSFNPEPGQFDDN